MSAVTRRHRIDVKIQAAHRLARPAPGDQVDPLSTRPAKSRRYSHALHGKAKRGQTLLYQIGERCVAGRRREARIDRDHLPKNVHRMLNPPLQAHQRVCQNRRNLTRKSTDHAA